MNPHRHKSPARHLAHAHPLRPVPTNHVCPELCACMCAPDTWVFCVCMYTCSRHVDSLCRGMYVYVLEMPGICVGVYESEMPVFCVCVATCVCMHVCPRCLRFVCGCPGFLSSLHVCMHMCMYVCPGCLYSCPLRLKLEAPAIHSGRLSASTKPWPSNSSPS